MQAMKYSEVEFSKRFDAALWRHLFRLLKPYWKTYLVVGCITAMLSGVDVLMPLAIRHAIDRGIAVKDMTEIYFASSVYILLIAMQSLLVWGFIRKSGKVGVRFVADLRRKLFTHLQTLSVSFFDETPAGWLLTRVMSDTQRVGETVTWAAVDFLWGIMMMIFMAVTMFIVDWRLALASMVLMPAMILVSVFFQKSILELARKVRKINSEITAGYSESITGLRVIKSLAREDRSNDEFREMTGSMYRAAVHSASVSSIYLPIIHVIGAVGSAFVIALGGSGSIAGIISLGTLVAFISYSRRFFEPAMDIARIFGQFQETQACAERLFRLLEMQPTVRDAPKIVPIRRLAGRVEFDEVGFSYDGRVDVLTQVNLTIQPGWKVALVGPTGGGKTTLANLLMRFHDPTSGVVRIDGVDLRHYPVESIRSQMGIVLQTPYLFSGTILENIRYGKLDASEHEIEEAARSAGAHEFISVLPEGYETRLEENGEPLSTGQKQMISIARAILADPAICILDEATASVDIETEFAIQGAMDVLLRGRTSVIIAHRLATIRQADRILVIREGRIAEAGTHAELLAMRGHYHELYCQQFVSSDREGLLRPMFGTAV